MIVETNLTSENPFLVYASDGRVRGGCRRIPMERIEMARLIYDEQKEKDTTKIIVSMKEMYNISLTEAFDTVHAMKEFYNL